MKIVDKNILIINISRIKQNISKSSFGFPGYSEVGDYTEYWFWGKPAFLQRSTQVKHSDDQVSMKYDDVKQYCLLILMFSIDIKTTVHREYSIPIQVLVSDFKSNRVVDSKNKNKHFRSVLSAQQIFEVLIFLQNSNMISTHLKLCDRSDTKL